MKGFKVIGRSGEFVPEERPIPDELLNDSYPYSYTKSDPGTYLLFLTPQALRELDEHIHWNKSDDENMIEQAGYMVGNVYKDPATGKLYAVAEHMVPARDTNSSFVHVIIGHDSNIDATNREMKLIEQSEGKLRRVGWYHTHPAFLNVFMSVTDAQTQKKDYFNDWQFALVLNPQALEWRAFHGGEVKEASCIFVVPEGEEYVDVAKFRTSSDDSVLKELRK
ncbi:MAG: hypothetical protein IK026_07245 [Eubacteriaceae bacterium]|nr:hypothetical protein [Eubacteriaceae bacterium]